VLDAAKYVLVFTVRQPAQVVGTVVLRVFVAVVNVPLPLSVFPRTGWQEVLGYQLMNANTAPVLAKVDMSVRAAAGLEDAASVAAAHDAFLGVGLLYPAVDAAYPAMA